MKKKSLELARVYELLEPGPVALVSTSLDGKPNIMTMTWHMMVDFVPPIIAIVMSNKNYSFNSLKKTKECVINIPSTDLIKQAVAIGNARGSKVDKFKKFGLTPVAASKVDAPLIDECFANLECKVINTTFANKYNIFILKCVAAWIAPSKKRPKMFHHAGNGIFIVDGKIIKLPSPKTARV